MSYFSQREFQAFVAAAVGHLNCSWLALAGRVLTKEQGRELEKLLDDFFRRTGHRSFNQHKQ